MTAPEFPPGHIIGGRYTVRSELGRGPRAATYSAITAPNREVAMRIAAAADPAVIGAIDRLHQVKSATRGVPPRLVGGILVIGSDEASGAAYVVTPMASWPSLAQIVEAGPLDAGELASFVTSLADALDALHGAGIAHLGLKPTNVFVGPAPERPVQLLDAGVPGILRRTQGTNALAWLAPEQVDDVDRGTAAADVFAAALLAFHALTGRALLRSAEARPLDVAAWRAELLRGPNASARARELGVELTERVDAAFRRALAPNPAERPRTAGELAAELVDALGGPSRAFEAAPPTDPEPTDPEPLDRARRVSPGALPVVLPDPGPSFDDDVPPAAPYRPPADTPGLISLVSRAAPPAAAVAPPPSSSGFGAADASGSASRVPLETMPFDPSLLAPVPGAGGPTAPAPPPAFQPTPESGVPALAPAPAPPAPSPFTSGRAFFLYGILGAIVTILGIGLVVVAFRHRSAKTAHHAPDAAPPSVSIVVAPPPPEVAAPGATAAPPAAEEPAPAPPAAPAAPAAPEGPTLTLRPGEGELAVSCEPRCAAVAIDGKVMPKAAEGPIAIRSGTHAIGVSKPGYSGGWKRVDVPAGKRTAVAFTLVPAGKKPCAKPPCK